MTTKYVRAVVSGKMGDGPIGRPTAWHGCVIRALPRSLNLRAHRFTLEFDRPPRTQRSLCSTLGSSEARRRPCTLPLGLDLELFALL